MFLRKVVLPDNTFPATIYNCKNNYDIDSILIPFSIFIPSSFMNREEGNPIIKNQGSTREQYNY
jgi:hypothetical protein